MNYSRPIVLSIAGFDPCGGAGVLADIKTFEQYRCLGMAVNTTITNQTEDTFISVNWFSSETIITHIKTLTNTYKIDFVKIVIIENLNTLHSIVTFLKQQNKNITIVWDTVLSASTGFEFITDLDKTKLQDVLSHIYLITPNTYEAKKLSGISDEKKAAEYLSQFCNVLLKGGHSKENEGVDFLYLKNKLIGLAAEALEAYEPIIIKKQTTLREPQCPISQKHGSGCILSSSIVSNLALGNDLHASCIKAKQYIETILSSNSNLLAYHVA
jgi:hydroxymethylpyrimidine/phosphomethylpyrimidine kinase